MLISAVGATIVALSASGGPRIGSNAGTARSRRPATTMVMPEWVPSTALSEVQEKEAVDAFDSMQTVELALPEAVADGPCMTRFLSTGVAPSDTPPLLLIHGFDISSLEYRRLLPRLRDAGIEAYAPCVAGWGFTETSSLKGVGTASKRAQLLAFHEQVIGADRPAMWVGASLGACIALDCYKERPSAFASFVSLAPGFFTPPPPAVPGFVGRFLLRNVLGTPDVRSSIAKQAYHVKEDQTDDAIRVGNLHLNREAWEDDSLEWLLGGAYGDISPSVPLLRDVPTLTLWGREDEVIPPAGLGSWPAAKLLAALPGGEFRWVEKSGHTPHLEQPAFTADAICAFARGEAIRGSSDTSDVVAAAKRWDATTEKAKELAAAAKETATSLATKGVALVKDRLDGTSN